MSEAGKAVFLSYASRDAEAARRISDALRSGGVEVWFDADGGLEHGDEWDAKIRRQIKECVLFIPLISANTQARHEGYFRIEWDVGAERARGIASGVPFILPVVIDDTREPEALVPDRFRAVQWTRLRVGKVRLTNSGAGAFRETQDAEPAVGPGGEATGALCARVKTLLARHDKHTPALKANSGEASRSHRGAPQIPDYELIRKIGEGGYGEVWLARGITGAYRAVKVIWRERFADTAPFEREFHGVKQSMALSTATGQLALLHVGQNERAGFFYYVMELADDADGGRETDPLRYVPLTFKELKARRGRLPAAECVRHGVEIARALAALHARGLLHRDIKPSNVILVDGVAKLADIGLVAAVDDARTFVGTEGFVPPEGPGTPSADVFALGKVLYELGTGLDRAEFPQMPADLGGAAERKAFFALNGVFLRACDPSPARRYRDASAMLVDLEALSAGWPVGRAVFSRASIRPLGFAALGIAAVWAIVAGWQWLRHPVAGPEQNRRQNVATASSRQFVAQAWEALHSVPEPFRAELDVASDFCRRAAELDSTDANVWATWAQVESWYVAQNVDGSAARRESARVKAARALTLAPRSYEARLAVACHLVRSEGFTIAHERRLKDLAPIVAEAEPSLRALLAERPDEPRALFALGGLFYIANRITESVALFNRLAQNSAWRATAYNSKGWALRDVPRWEEAMEAANQSIAAKPFFGNLRLQMGIAQNWLGDFDLAKRALERIPPAEQREDAGVEAAVTLYWFRREPAEMLRVLKGVPRDWLQTNGFAGPKDFWVGLAHAMAGNAELANRAWRSGLRLVDQRLGDDPNSAKLHFLKGRLHALLGERAVARGEFDLARKLGGGGGLIAAIAIGDVEQAFPQLKRYVWAWLRSWPELDPLRDDPRFAAELAAAAGNPKRSPHAPKAPATNTP